MAPAFVNNTMAYLARTKPSVCLGIASMDFAAVISARACVMLARKLEKGKDTMAYVGPSRRAKILTTNVILGNAAVRERVISRKHRKPMERCVRRRDNALRAIALTAFVVTRLARDCAALARRRKKDKAQMELVVLSLPSPILRTSVESAAGAAAMRRASITIARHARRGRNVSPIIASTAFVAATCAPERVMRVPQRKKVKDPMVHVDRSPIRAILTMSATLANVMVPGLAISCKCSSPMAPLALWRVNAHRAFAVMACVATRHVRASAKLVRRPKKEAVRMAHVGASNTTPTLTTNVLRGLVRAAGRANSTMA